MPQLPSGRHVGINAQNLEKLLEVVPRGIRVNELMSIEGIEQLMNYIDVHYFRPAASDDNKDEFVDGSNKPPEGLISYASGFTVATIQEELAHWPAADRDAFLAFLEETRTKKYFNGILESIEKYKRLLWEHGNLIAAVQIGWWRAGCHPLQPEVYEEETGISERKRHN